MECYKEEWNHALPVAITMIVLYPIGILVLFMVLLYRREKWKLPALRKALTFLYQGYDEGTWWWELMEMANKIVLTCVIKLFGQLWQPRIGMLWCVFFMLLVLMKRPYKFAILDRLALFAEVEILLILLALHTLEESGPLLEDSIGDIILSIVMLGMFLFIILLGLVLVGRQGLNLIHKYRMWRATKGKPKLKDLARLPSVQNNLEHNPSATEVEMGVIHA